MFVDDWPHQMHAFTNGADGADPTGTLVLAAGGTIVGGTATGQLFSTPP